MGVNKKNKRFADKGLFWYEDQAQQCTFEELYKSTTKKHIADVLSEEFTDIFEDVTLNNALVFKEKYEAIIEKGVQMYKQSGNYSKDLVIACVLHNAMSSVHKFLPIIGKLEDNFRRKVADKKIGDGDISELYDKLERSFYLLVGKLTREMSEMLQLDTDVFSWNKLLFEHHDILDNCLICNTLDHKKYWDIEEVVLSTDDVIKYFKTASEMCKEYLTTFICTNSSNVFRYIFTHFMYNKSGIEYFQISAYICECLESNTLNKNDELTRAVMEFLYYRSQCMDAKSFKVEYWDTPDFMDFSKPSSGKVIYSRTMTGEEMRARFNESGSTAVSGLNPKTEELVLKYINKDSN